MRRIFISSLAISFFAVLALLAGSAPARAKGDEMPPVIRDAEMERTLREYTIPIFKAAGLDPLAVRIYILQSDQINAFVAGGENLFIYTGLLVRTQRPGQLIGVVAHESGHIAGGHLVRAQQEMSDAPIQTLIGAVLSGQVLLRYTRVIEASADAAALGFLDKLHWSASGMAEFLRILLVQENITYGHLDPYLINHPLTRDRIDVVEQHIAQSPWSNVPDPPDWVRQHNRMVAKLVGFLWPFQQVMIKYPLSDNSVPARYARAIAYWRAGDINTGISMMNQLTTEFPNDAYFWEQKGQILFDAARGPDAIDAYSRAARLAPDEPLISMELANVQIEQEDPTLLPAAIVELKDVLRTESRDPDPWRMLGIAYGRSGQIGLATWALAESSAAAGNDKEARQRASQAMKQLPMGSPEWLRSQDIFTAPKPPDDKSSGGISG
ncbi:MAG TPA: M48 family metalloprotease [Dongiaceae bacterium]|jgi:predicted Zn-dependent protease|nr:M48 family metalloprotease [Dongiaceae bacterium]